MSINSVTYAVQNEYSYTSSKTTESDTTSSTNTVIEANYKYNGKLEEYEQKVLDYYTNQVKESKTFSDPAAHIKDKYFNQSSPYYRSDMTKRERSIAYQNEMRVLNGNGIGVDMSDYALRGEEYLYGYVEDALEAQNERTSVNQAIQSIFAENGIVIPNGETVSFQINPYTYQLTATGLSDVSVLSKIEEVLNQGDNAKNLYHHIYSSSIGDFIESSQMDTYAKKKMQAYREVLNVTGYDLIQCENKDGTFYAEDGTDVLQLYLNSTFGIQHEVAEIYNPLLRNLAKNGFNSTADLILSIDYSNGELIDVGQENGYSSTNSEWISNLIESYGTESRTGFSAQA